MDSTTSIDTLKRLVVEFRDEREWKQFHNPKDLAISISIEASELLAEFQWKSTSEVKNFLRSSDKLNNISEEMADIVVYCLSLCNILEIDLSTAIKNKIAKNAVKYPVEKAKGTASKYTEL